jgi:hypothetical protein
MSGEGLLGLFVLLVAGWLSLSTLQARERALAHARRACERTGVQLLDQTVALRGARLRWTSQGLRLRRTYGFEFSEAGVERRNGRVVLIGLVLESLSMEASAAAPGGDDAAI